MVPTYHPGKEVGSGAPGRPHPWEEGECVVRRGPWCKVLPPPSTSFAGRRVWTRPQARSGRPPAKDRTVSLQESRRRGEGPFSCATDSPVSFLTGFVPTRGRGRAREGVRV